MVRLAEFSRAVSYADLSVEIKRFGLIMEYCWKF
jgi:hypothetical protein